MTPHQDPQIQESTLLQWLREDLNRVEKKVDMLISAPRTETHQAPCPLLEEHLKASDKQSGRWWGLAMSLISTAAVAAAATLLVLWASHYKP
jgi:hypothetical protein